MTVDTTKNSVWLATWPRRILQVIFSVYQLHFLYIFSVDLKKAFHSVLREDLSVVLRRLVFCSHDLKLTINMVIVIPKLLYFSEISCLGAPRAYLTSNAYVQSRKSVNLTV